MKRSQSYWDSDDEDDGPRTYRNVRPAAAGIQHGGGHNLSSVMHRDYVKSRHAMGLIDDEIHRVRFIRKIYLEDLTSPDWSVRAEAGYNIERADREIKRLRRRWSFEANNYHRYDDVGALTDNAYHAYTAHASNQ
tara:strand:- start:287 stop:691 length:405 start_codon:yes stop_codon:yes gene_type:complete